MTHILATSVREKFHLEEYQNLVRLNEQSTVEQTHLDMAYYSVPNDASILKQFTPLYISSHGARPQYMWASREFEAHKHKIGTFPAYIVTGFGLLDAFMHAQATNSTLVLHPLDIVLSVCYGYGNERKKPILNNNEELKNPMQVNLKQEFTRANLLLGIAARLARRVETYPLGKLFGLINSEFNSPDPLVIRLIFGVLSYLAATREATRMTFEQFKQMFDLYKHSRVEQLADSIVPLWNGLPDIRHDPAAPTFGRIGLKEGAGNHITPNENLVKFDKAKGSADHEDEGAEKPSAAAASSKRPDPNESRFHQLIREANFVAAVAAANTESKEAEKAGPTNDERVEKELMYDVNLEDEGGTEGSTTNTGGQHDKDATEAVRVSRKSHPSPIHGIDVLNVISTDATTNSTLTPQATQDVNNSNLTEEQEAAEWFLKPRIPSRLYKFQNETSINSVLFIGSQRAWLELPEMLHELGQFFMLDAALLSKITKVGQKLQRTRLNLGRDQRKWWQKALFKNGPTEALPDGDFMINGWLALLLGERVISESCPMTINKLSDLKPGVRLPVLLVRQPMGSMDDTDDAVLNPENGLTLTRLHYYDEYREKFVNSSSNARDVSVGLFMPWRSCDALARTRKVWQQPDGDAPGAATVRSSEETYRTAKNLNNAEAPTSYGHMAERERISDEDVSVKLWTAKHQSSAKSSLFSCCCRRSKRRPNNVTEPMFNMSCLLTGLGGFSLYDNGDTTGSIPRMCVRPLCFMDIVHEE